MAYVYLHKKDNGSIFYVGKGNGYRAWQKSNRSEYWNRVKNKYGLNVVIFKDNMSDEDALSLEMELIEAIGLKKLTNLTLGGDGALGLKHSEQTKQKIGKANSGGTSWSKGVKLSKKHRGKISKANKGKKRSKEQIKLMSKVMKGTCYAGHKILDTKTNIEYQSLSKYCEKYNLNNSTVWNNLNGKTKINKYKNIKYI